MKKLLALLLMSLVSVNCMASWPWEHHRRTVRIINNTDDTINASDENNHTVRVRPGGSSSLQITVKENHGTAVPSLLMPYVTTITVSDHGDSNTIEIDEHTQSIEVNDGLELSKDGGSGHRHSHHHHHDDEDYQD